MRRKLEIQGPTYCKFPFLCWRVRVTSCQSCRSRDSDSKLHTCFAIPTLRSLSESPLQTPLFAIHLSYLLYLSIVNLVPSKSRAENCCLAPTAIDILIRNLDSLHRSRIISSPGRNFSDPSPLLYTILSSPPSKSSSLASNHSTGVPHHRKKWTS